MCLRSRDCNEGFFSKHLMGTIIFGSVVDYIFNAVVVILSLLTLELGEIAHIVAGKFNYGCTLFSLLL